MIVNEILEHLKIQLQAALIKNIREEFEHNLSQQVYVSGPAWDLVRNAKEEAIKTGMFRVPIDEAQPGAVN